MGVTKNGVGLIAKGVAGAVGLLMPAVAMAAQLNLEILGPDGRALPHAAVALRSESSAAEPSRTGAAHAVMDQREREFNPYVLTVATDTLVSFPNSDDIRHHVYSFSPAKRFELRLYHGTTAEPVLFDRAGTVTLGCNIHDAMIAFIYVVDSDWHGVTDREGQLQWENLPAGTYELQIQHPRLSQPKTQTLTLPASGSVSEQFQIDSLGPDPRADREPSDLQRLFDQ